MRVRLVDDPLAEVGEGVRVGVGVSAGPMEFQLINTKVGSSISCQLSARPRVKGQLMD